MSSPSDFSEAPIVVHGPYASQDGDSSTEYSEVLSLPLYLAQQSGHTVDVDTQSTDVVTQEEEERMQVPMGSFEEFEFSGLVSMESVGKKHLYEKPGYSDITFNIPSRYGGHRKALCAWLFALESRILSPEGAGYKVVDRPRGREFTPVDKEGILAEKVSWTWKSDMPQELEWRMEMVMQEGVQEIQDGDGPLTFLQEEADKQFATPTEDDGSNMFSVDPSTFKSSGRDPSQDRVVVETLTELPSGWDSDGAGWQSLGIVDEKRYERKVNIDKTQQLSGMGEGESSGKSTNMGLVNSGVQSTVTVSGKVSEEHIVNGTSIPPDKQSLEGFCDWVAGTRSARMALYDGMTFRMFPGTASTAETTFNEGEERWVEYRFEIEIGNVAYDPE